jgi:predicted DNA-binding protein
MPVNKGITTNRRGPGRPATGRDPVLAIRLSDELREAVEQWARSMKMTRSEAIRALIRKGLKK